MKKTLFTTATAVMCFFISCKDTSTSGDTSSNSINERNKASNREIIRALTTGDVSKVDSFVDKDILDHGDMGDAQGIDTLKKMFSEMHTHFKDLKLEPVAESTDGDYFISYYRMTGTTADASMGMPVGTKLDLTGVDVIKTKNGKAAEHWSFSQPRDMMKMMNMDPTMKPCMDKMMEMQNKMKSKMNGNGPNMDKKMNPKDSSKTSV